MSFESVRAWLAEHAPELRLIEAHASTATVADAAETLGVTPGQIAKHVGFLAAHHFLDLQSHKPRGRRIDEGDHAIGGNPANSFTRRVEDQLP